VILVSPPREPGAGKTNKKAHDPAPVRPHGRGGLTGLATSRRDRDVALRERGFSLSKGASSGSLRFVKVRGPKNLVTTGVEAGSDGAVVGINLNQGTDGPHRGDQ